MRNRFRFMLGAIVIVLGAVNMGFAAVPTLMNYQGVLLNSGGQPITTQVTVVFTIYDAPALGNNLWDEERQVTPDANGRFSINLGEVDNLTDAVFAAPDRWLGIKVGADPEMTPRIRLATVPYAFRAATVDGATGGSIGGDVTVLGGNVGIGITSPAATLHVIGSSTDIPLRVVGGNQTFLERTGTGIVNLLALYNPDQTDNNGVCLTFRSDEGATPSQLFAEITVQYTSHSPRNADFVFSARNNGLWDEQLRIVSNGNVGIGTATPAEKLDVAGNVHASGLIRSGFSLILDGPNDRLLTSTGQMYLGREPGTGDFGDVRVGIGTQTAGATLDIKGDIKIDDGAAVAGYVLTASDATGLASWQAASSGGGGWVDDGAVVRLQTGTDKVGIGTTTPSEQLEITGNLRLPVSTASVGVIKSGGTPFIHNFGTQNTFIGLNAGNLTMTGYNNTASGYNALYSNTTGQDNTASGYTALKSNTTGRDNTASGYQTLYWNTTGHYNTASGSSALQNNTTGNFNTASGDDALYSNTTGYSNTASGGNALYSNTTGIGSTASGSEALLSNTTGNYNTAIGYMANVSTGALTNATAIGNGAIVNASNKIRLGNSAVTVIEGQVAYTFTSDRNEKENFRPVDGDEVLGKIRGLGLTSWNYKGQNPQQFRHYGPVAQEFFEAFGHDGVGTSGTPTTINSGDMAGILMIAVQALEKRTAEVETIKAENEDMKKQVEQLQALVQKLLDEQK